MILSRKWRHCVPPEANPIAVAAYRDQIRILAELLLPQVLRRTEALFSLAQLFSQHPDSSIFDSLPGAGELLAPGLLAKFGDHRDRFPTPAGIQALASTCPVTKKSGKRKVVIFRRG
jgi:transposase